MRQGENVRHHANWPTTIGRDGVLSMECYTCKKVSHIVELYRCFDCGVWLCRDCVPGHFSNRHEPHPLHIHEWECRLAAMKADGLEEAIEHLCESKDTCMCYEKSVSNIRRAAMKARESGKVPA